MATKSKAKTRGKTAQEAFQDLEQEKQVEDAATTTPFNFQSYQVTQQPSSVKVKIEATGDEFEVTIRALSWSRRNQILAKSLKWSSDGQTNFDGDLYTRNCLKEMVIDAPWGRTTEAFLLSIDERLGAALETLVPRAFGEPTDDQEGEVNLNQVDDIKKEF